MWVYSIYPHALARVVCVYSGISCSKTRATRQAETGSPALNIPIFKLSGARAIIPWIYLYSMRTQTLTIEVGTLCVQQKVRRGRTKLAESSITKKNQYAATKTACALAVHEAEWRRNKRVISKPKTEHQCHYTHLNKKSTYRYIRIYVCYCVPRAFMSSSKFSLVESLYLLPRNSGMLMLLLLLVGVYTERINKATTTSWLACSDVLFMKLRELTLYIYSRERKRERGQEREVRFVPWLLNDWTWSSIVESDWDLLSRLPAACCVMLSALLQRR